MADEDKAEVTEEVIVPETPDPTALASDGQVLAAIASLSTQVSIGLEMVNARIDALVAEPPAPPPAPAPEPEPEAVVIEVKDEPEVKVEAESEKGKNEPKRRTSWLD